MYRIAICEDEKVFSDENEKICFSIMEKLNAEFELDSFSNAAEFLNGFSGKCKKYDLLLLDIIMEDGAINGVELARKIREQDNDAVIIFITSKSEYAVQGYGVNALYYFMKPVDGDALERLIAADYHRRCRHSYLVFKSGVQHLRIPIKDVVFLEITGRRVAINLIDNTTSEYYGKLTDFLNKANPFVRCHSSFAVNICNIRELTKTDAVTLNGKTIPVSRAYFKDTQKAFMRQLRGEYNV